jgi:hypothetical protein
MGPPRRKEVGRGQYLYVIVTSTFNSSRILSCASPLSNGSESVQVCLSSD